VGQQENNMQPVKRDEIDLLELITSFFRGLKSSLRYMGTIFGITAIYLLRKSLWLLLFVAIGAGVGAIYYNRTTKVYRSEAIIRSNNLASNIIVASIEKLNNLFLVGNHQELSRLFDMSEVETAKICHLSTYYGLLPKRSINIDQPVCYASDNLRDTAAGLMPSKYLKIVAEVLDEDIYPKLMSGLLSFINSSAFSNELNVLRVEQLKTQIAYTEKGIAALLYLQATPPSQNVAAPIRLELNSSTKKSEVVQLQDAINELYEKKIELERELTLFMNPTTVISDFSKVYRPVNSLRTYVLLGAAATFVFGLIVLLLLDNRKKIANAIRGTT
jgi:hypothetical protein